MFPTHWTRSSIGELCEMIKGDSQIVRTKPGPYPLVTTGEERKTADHYQFDGAAVCVPMISAYGHGKPGLKRVQYQEGKFALANILTALLVRDISTLTPRFLHLFLEYYKDQLIVPLQTGVANMALTIAKLATVPVAFPPLDEQHRIVRIFDETETLRQLRARADERMAEFIPALFNEMFGDPDINPKRWTTKTVEDSVDLINGRAFKPDEWVKSGLPIIRIQNLKDADAPFNYYDKEFDRKFYVQPGDLLLSWAGQLISFGVHIWNGPYGVLNQHIFKVIPKEPFTLEYLEFALDRIIDVAKHSFHGTEMKHLTRGTLDKGILPIPPLTLQREFAARVTEARALQDQQAQSRSQLEAGFQAVLHRAFKGEL